MTEGKAIILAIQADITDDTPRLTAADCRGEVTPCVCRTCLGE